MSDKRPFHNPFAALGGLRGVPAPEPAAEPAPDARSDAAQGPDGAGRFPRAVVRYERAGRGGKAVTVIEKVTLTPAQQAEWLKALKSTLGCGGTVEDGRIVLQGDHRTRLPAWLTARGVKKVTVS